jgi:hypothetical protein
MRLSARLYALAMVCSISVIACGPPSGRGAAARISQQVDSHVGQVIDLRDAVPAPWTRMYIFGPYTTQDRAELMLGQPWPYKWGHIEAMDDRTFVVFTDSSQIVAAFDQLNANGLFAEPEGRNGYPRDSVRFLVRDRGTFPSGEPYRELIWVP